jgi:membrane protease YdiL (CAAX protease family)
VGDRPRWGLGDAIAGWILGVVGATVLGSLVPVGRSGKPTLGGEALSEVGLWIGLVGVVVLASRRKGTGSLADDFGLRVERRDLSGLALGVICQLVAVPAIYVPLSWLIGQRDVGKPARELAAQAHGVPYVGFALAVAVVAPVVEELFFRGLVLRSLERRVGTAWAVVGSAVAFGLAHFELLQLPALVGVGVVCGVLAVRTGRLGPGIFVHAAFNAVAVATLAGSR